MHNSETVVSREYLAAQKRAMEAAREDFKRDGLSLNAVELTEHYMAIYLPYGPMIVNRHDPTIIPCLYDNVVEIAILQPFAQGVVIDVGANVGSHSINFAQTAAKVYAFEPHPQTYCHLCANVLLHQAWNVEPLNLALGNQDGAATMHNIDATKLATPMGARIGAGTTPVKMVKLDSLGLGVDFMKIDVEGYEYEVLLGAKQTLIRNDVAVFVEIHVPELVPEIHAYMESLGFKHAACLKNVYVEDNSLLTDGYMYWKNDRIVWVE